ncbi:hypothetical protein [Pseudidiomarina salilacus]|uniref:hypothetical protein n=1 Tax=Pseudidiomarina salilacus TaxID=3384452 RepID=UPI003984F07B
MKQASPDNSVTLWDTDQEQALQALGLTVWQAAGTENLIHSAEQVHIYYQLGQWLLQTQEQLPVQLNRWTQDVFRALDPNQLHPKPVEVAAATAKTWAAERRLNGTEILAQPLAAQQKRQLWAKLCGAPNR